MNITVYCGANPGHAAACGERTKELGSWIADRGHTLIYGGGAVGLMGLLADTVLQHGGSVIGIIPNFFIERGVARRHLTELIAVETMSQRKKMMIDMGDAFIALPGGPGTLEEITEAISWTHLDQNDGPCILYNVNGYYEPLQAMYRAMVAGGFFSRADFDKIL